MVKLKKIALENYCGYRNTTFDFTDKNGQVKPIAVFYGPNGSGKTSVLNAIQILCASYQFKGRDNQFVFRKVNYHPDYDPTLSQFKEFEHKMRIEGIFETQESEKRVLITREGVEIDELPFKEYPREHCYYLNADSPLNLYRFQIPCEMEIPFLDFAETIYGYKCSVAKLPEKSVAMELVRETKGFYTDFIIEKHNTKVHYRSMSVGERKIAQLCIALCNKEWMDNIDIILIDSIDREIYFRRHAIVIDKFLNMFPTKQFIVTTHSGTMIQHMREKHGPEYLYDIEEYINKS
jgi:AAA15 family ATPase/GTPase